MILFINKGKLERIFKANEKEAKSLLNKFLESYPLVVTRDNFATVIIHFKDKEDYAANSEKMNITVKRGASYLLQISLPDKKDKNYYKDCLYIAKEFFNAYPMVEESSELLELLMEYGEGDIVLQ